MELRSTITGPVLGFRMEETMPPDSCQVLYRCPNCGEVLKAKEGDCCVFSSCGSARCPPMQENGWEGALTPTFRNFQIAKL